VKGDPIIERALEKEKGGDTEEKKKNFLGKAPVMRDPVSRPETFMKKKRSWEE